MRTLGKDPGLSIGFCNEARWLDAEQLSGYKPLIVVRDGMLWPDGYIGPAGPAGAL